MCNMPINAFFEACAVRQPMICMPLLVHTAPTKSQRSRCRSAISPLAEVGRSENRDGLTGFLLVRPIV